MWQLTDDLAWIKYNAGFNFKTIPLLNAKSHDVAFHISNVYQKVPLLVNEKRLFLLAQSGKVIGDG